MLKELEQMQVTDTANLGQALQLLKRIHELKLETLFPNDCFMWWIFCALPVMVVQAEW